MAVSDEQSIPLDAWRTGEDLIGPKIETNFVFGTPEGFIIDLEGGFYFRLFRNGQLLNLGTQYSILSVDGIGVGVKVVRALRGFESDYIANVS